MPLVDLVDDTFVVADLHVVAAVVADPGQWATWWPDLELRVQRARGVKGVQWHARSVAGTARPLVGTLEVWLEPWGDGVLCHHYARLDAAGWREGQMQQRRWADRERQRRARAWKRHVHALKDALEAGRAPGEPRDALLVRRASSSEELPATGGASPSGEDGIQGASPSGR